MDSAALHDAPAPAAASAPLGGLSSGFSGMAGGTSELQGALPAIGESEPSAMSGTGTGGGDTGTLGGAPTGGETGTTGGSAAPKKEKGVKRLLSKMRSSAGGSSMKSSRTGASTDLGAAGASTSVRRSRFQLDSVAHAVARVVPHMCALVMLMSCLYAVFVDKLFRTLSDGVAVADCW